jgi:hypothetical protein
MAQQRLSYEDLCLQLVPDEAPSYRILAHCGDEKESGTFKLPAECWRPPATAGGGARDILQLSTIDPSGDQPGAAKPALLAARETGDCLFRALLPGRVRDLFQRALGRTEKRPRTGLRLRIQLDYRDPRAFLLTDVPWELLFWAEGHGFLALSRTSPVIRSAVVPRAVRVPAFAGPLDILAVAASPRGLPKLDLARERRGIKAALTGGLAARATFVEPVGALDLQRIWGRNTFHILHFMGHGGFDEVSRHGRLLVTGANRSPEALTDDQLVELLDRDAAPALVVLNACHGAAGHAVPDEHPAGLAPSLLLAGLPAVVAMRRAIRDDAAIAWSSAFYSALVSGHPLEAAVAEGRKAIHSLNPSSTDWAIPALFLGNAQSHLAEVEPQPANLSTRRGPTHRSQVHVGLGDIEEVERLEIIGIGPPVPCVPAPPSISAAPSVPLDTRSAEGDGPSGATVANHVEVRAGDIRQVRNVRIVGKEETT